MKEEQLMKNTLACGAIVLLALTIGSAATVSSEEPTTDAPMIVQVTDQGPAPEGVALPGHAWYKFASHAHTTCSDGYATVEKRIQSAAADGADAIAILDHRTQAACSDPGFKTIGGCVPMCGEEWGWDGHLGMLNMRPGDPMADWTVEKAIQEALSRGATIMVHHPRNGSDDAWPYEYIQPGIRGIEVWNSISYALSSSGAATVWWNEHLVKGRMVVAIGGSDMHLMGTTLVPCNHVLATSPEPDALQQGIEAGRITITMDKSTARCFVWCDTDSDGTFETAMGATVPVTENRTLPFRFEVYAGQGETLKVIDKTGVAATLTIGEGNPWRADLAAAVGPDTKDYLRAEIPDPDDRLNPMDCITNPIYVNYTPEQ
jgi:hypothetical protein